MVQIEEWEGDRSDRRFNAYLDQFRAEHGRLKSIHQRLKPKVRNYFRLLREGAARGESRSDDLMSQVRADLTEQSNELLDGIYDFISRGLLQCGVTYAARTACLVTLGFDLDPATIKPPLTLNHMMALFGIISVILLGVFVTFGTPSDVRFDELLARIVMISILYSVATVCAVFPKERWSFARREANNVRPVAFYFAAGALAAVTSLGISFLYNLSIFQSLPRTWTHSLLTYPWCLSSFAAAFMVAWMTDDTPTSLLTRARLRWVEGLAGAGTLAVTVLMIFRWLDAVATNHQASPAHRSPLPVALTMTCAIGFMIGFLIPTWYREVHKEEGSVIDAELVDRLPPLGMSA